MGPCQQSQSIHEGCPSPGDAGVGDTSGMEVTGEAELVVTLLEEAEGTEGGYRGVLPWIKG